MLEATIAAQQAPTRDEIAAAIGCHEAQPAPAPGAADPLSTSTATYASWTMDEGPAAAVRAMAVDQGADDSLDGSFQVLHSARTDWAAAVADDRTSIRAGTVRDRKAALEQGQEAAPSRAPSPAAAMEA